MSYRGIPFFQQHELESVRRLRESVENGQTPPPGKEDIFACAEQAEALATQCQKIPGCGPIVKQLTALADKLHQVAGVQPDTPQPGQPLPQQQKPQQPGKPAMASREHAPYC